MPDILLNQNSNMISFLTEYLNQKFVFRKNNCAFKSNILNADLANEIKVAKI